MTDLYNLLHVRRNASAKTIRAAYRKLAKTAHPDTPTGSPEKFAQIKRAHDILTDPEARAHYDATGEIRDKQADAGRGPVLAIIIQAIDHIVQQAIEQNADILFEDVCGLAAALIRKRIDSISKALNLCQKKEQQYVRLIGRFTVNEDEENSIEPIVAGRLSGLREEARTHGIQKAFAEQALDMVTSHSFRAEVKQVVMVNRAFGMTTSTTSF